MADMNLSRVRLMAATMVLLISAACGDDGGSNDTDASESEPTAVTPSESVDATATVQQYASIVARTHAELVDAIATADACGFPDASPQGDLECGLTPLTLENVAATLRISLVGAAKQGVPAYVGAPPSELEDLVSETIDVASALTKAANRLDAGCANGRTPDCQQQRTALWLATNEMENVLQAWGPYL